MTVLHHNQPSVVVVAADEYRRLKRRDKHVIATEEQPERMIDQEATTAKNPRFAHLEVAG